MTAIRIRVSCNFCGKITRLAKDSEPAVYGVAQFLCGDPVFTTDVLTRSANNTAHICFDCVDRINKLRGKL